MKTKRAIIVDSTKPIVSKVQNQTFEYSVSENKKIKGILDIKVLDTEGNIIQKHHTENLVVIVGRSWLMQKAFNVDYDSSNPVRHLFLSWFEVGSGGADPSTPFTPIAPNDSDTALFNRVQFGTNPAIYTDGGYKKNFTSLEYPDETTAKLILTVDNTEVADGTLINEAGIFAGNSSDPTAATEFNLFSHATFPSIYKDSTNEIVIEWYFLF